MRIVVTTYLVNVLTRCSSDRQGENETTCSYETFHLWLFQGSQSLCRLGDDVTIEAVAGAGAVCADSEFLTSSSRTKREPLLFHP